MDKITIIGRPHTPAGGNCLGHGRGHCFEILREMVRSLKSGELSDELIAKVDTIPEVIKDLFSESDLYTVIGYIQGCNIDPDIRQSIIGDLEWEIEHMEKKKLGPLALIDKIEAEG